MEKVREILPGIYTFQIPLPKSPLKALNTYVIKSRERSLIIDTGWDQEECLVPMLSGLEEIEIDMSRADIFITHMHADHAGLAAKLARKETEVYFGRKEASVKLAIDGKLKERVEEVARSNRLHGFPEEELRYMLRHHPGFRYSSPTPQNLKTVVEGDILRIGEYSLRCIDTPGHSPGHVCMYEEKKKILFAGDHILFDITPNITRWPEMENALERYLESLQKVYNLEVNTVLPGHRNIMNDHRGRIAQLREHHGRRLDEVLSALESGEKTAWDVAPHLTWDIKVRSWEQFPPVQKWFAVGETLAHLNYLLSKGSIRSREYKGRILFSRAAGRKAERPLLC